MNGTESLLREFDRWDEDLGRLEDRCAADDGAQRERLMATAQRTVAAYHGRILPRELVRPGHDRQLELHIYETLAVTRALGTVVRRFHQCDHAKRS